MRVFISCVTKEFGGYRAELRAALTRHRDIDVKVQEDFGDGGGKLLEKLDDYIRACDAVIHLVGDGAGSRPEAPAVARLLATYPDLPSDLPPLAADLAADLCPLSYTQWEAVLALYHRRPCYIYFAHPDSQREPGWAATDADRDAQDAHRARLRALGEDRSEQTFDNADRLALRFFASFIEIDRRRAPPRMDPNRVYAWPGLSVTPAHRLADREEEVRLFAELLSAQDDLRVLLLHGPSDRGKSVLMAELDALARQVSRHQISQGGGALAVGFGELRTGVPLDTVLANLRRDLCHLRFPRYDAEPDAAGSERRRAAFLDDLQETPDPVLLLLDTYEQISADAERWVQDHLLACCPRHAGLKLVIAGQQVPAMSGPLGRVAHCRELPPIPHPEPWRAYYERVLRGRRPLSEAQFDALLIGCQGSPRVMGTLLANLAQAA
jgi:hypothetical protein